MMMAVRSVVPALKISIEHLDHMPLHGVIGFDGGVLWPNFGADTAGLGAEMVMNRIRGPVIHART